ncbi:MAG: hybrid sensor histidine kinase/response regulator [Gammaproteobacteria bacterium]|nr:hybrid sensor histidine kinase/response regulator [Gammaproteobacteria bacterium]
MQWSDLTGMKVLLVDDTAANLDVLSKTLSSENYEIALAQSGEQALKTATYFHPDLILLDIMMPGMDGYETSRQLKANAATSEIPIIFITAKSAIEDIIKGFEYGCVDYIVKPFQQTEVCARVKTHLQLQSAKKSLVELNQQKNRLLGIAAHDIRGPLAGIQANLEIVKDFELKLSDEKKSECIDIAYSTSNQLLTLVNDLLDASVIATGELRVQIDSGDLKELIDQRLNLYHMQAKIKHITLSADLSVNPQVLMDKNRITQVIDNLINNAIKFTDSNKSIHVRLEIIKDFAITSVIDEGSGFSKEEQEYIFSDVNKLDHPPTAGEKSTCLGLAIARKIITSHNGELFLKSHPGKGSQFSFSLPLDTHNP